MVSGILTLPDALASDRSARSASTVDVPVRLAVHLPEGADSVAIELAIDNRARDHRLRVRFPTGLAASSTLAESAFGLVRRDGRLPESSGWQERPGGVFALRRFVAIEPGDGDCGLQILAEGVHEYGMPAAGTVDLTVLRCVGWLARTDHPLRPHKIGPELATPGAQCPGQHRFRFAVRPFPASGGRGHLYRAAEEFSVPLQAYAPLGRAPGLRPRLPLGLALEPDDVVLSAVKTAEDGNGLLVRVFNSADRPLAAVLRAAFPLASAERCDLEERSRTAVEVGADGSVEIPLAPAQIVTVLLHPRYDERDPTEQEVGPP